MAPLVTVSSFPARVPPVQVHDEPVYPVKVVVSPRTYVPAEMLALIPAPSVVVVVVGAGSAPLMTAVPPAFGVNVNVNSLPVAVPPLSLVTTLCNVTAAGWSSLVMEQTTFWPWVIATELTLLAVVTVTGALLAAVSTQVHADVV